MPGGHGRRAATQARRDGSGPVDRIAADRSVACMRASGDTAALLQPDLRGVMVANRRVACVVPASRLSGDTAALLHQDLRGAMDRSRRQGCRGPQCFMRCASFATERRHDRVALPGSCVLASRPSSEVRGAEPRHSGSSWSLLRIRRAERSGSRSLRARLRRLLLHRESARRDGSVPST